ncbi:MAG: DNA polymerase subunit beta [Candidatus Lokiarchaeota archaeon]|nr:DNA polymerase subunit beta [Candidatus Lokiarchaeota archaeon]
MLMMPENIQEDLKALSDYDVLLFGSWANGTPGPTSDIDIAVLVHTEDKEVIKHKKLKFLGKVPDRYDVTIFEALPTIVKGSILQNYQVIFGDPLEIGEYLRKYWKEWQDFQHRIEFPTLEEMREKRTESILRSLELDKSKSRQ